MMDTFRIHIRDSIFAIVARIITFIISEPRRAL
jgi:hypothetical protein